MILLDAKTAIITLFGTHPLFSVWKISDNLVRIFNFQLDRTIYCFQAFLVTFRKILKFVKLFDSGLLLFLLSLTSSSYPLTFYSSVRPYYLFVRASTLLSLHLISIYRFISVHSARVTSGMPPSGDVGCISFIAPSTLIDPAFWEELYERKLNIYKLGTESEQISIHYSCSDSKNVESFVLEKKSFNNLTPYETSSMGRLNAKGVLINVNTIEVRLIVRSSIFESNVNKLILQWESQ